MCPAERAPVGATRTRFRTRRTPPLPDLVEQRELTELLDAEVARLPARLRHPVVLCYLGGVTTEDAARELGCPSGTVLSRLAAARARLASRLTRRGVTLPAVLVIAGGSSLAPRAVSATLALARQFALGSGPLTTSISLAHGVIHTMNRTTLLTALGGVLLAAALSGVGFVLAQNGTPAGENGASSANVPVAPPEPKNVPAKPKPAPNAADQELEEKLAKLERYRSHLQAEIDVAEKAIELQERASGAAGNSDPMQAFRIRYLETEKLLTAINREIDRLSAEIKVLKSRLKEAPVNAQNDAALLAQLVAENPQVKAAQQRLNKLRETLEIMRKNVPDPDNPSIHELKASLRESQQDLIAAEKLAIGLATEELRARSLADIQKRIPELQLQVDIKVEEREGIRRERDAVKKVIENTTGSGRSSEDLRKAIEPQREMLAKLNRQALLLRTQREGITLTDHSTNDTKLDAILKELAELRKEVQELKRMPR